MGSLAYLPQRIIHVVAVCQNDNCGKTWNLEKSLIDFRREFKDKVDLCAFCREQSIKYYEGLDINQ